MDLEVVVTRDDEFGVVVSSELEEELGVLDLGVVAVELESLIRAPECLVEKILSHIVESSFSADDVESGLVLVEREAVG